MAQPASQRPWQMKEFLPSKLAERWVLLNFVCELVWVEINM